MNEQQEILDTPLDGLAAMAANNRKFASRNRIDFGINVFMVAIATLLGLTVLAAPDMVILALLWHLMLGGYQLLSASIGAIRGNVQKAYYLCFAIVYPILLFPLAQWLSNVTEGDAEKVVLGLVLYLLPLLGAFYFTMLSYHAKKSSSAL
jgi:hypothetical protein